MRSFIKHKEWIGLLVYPFFLCLCLSAYGQKQTPQTLLNLQLKPGQSPSPPKSEEALKDIYFENLHDVFYLIFHESDSAFEALKEMEEQRLDAIENFQLPSPWKGFLQAEIKLQWAFLKLKYGEEWNAFWSLKSANRSIEENLEAYPSFKLNNRTRGLLNILFGVTPDNYQWVFKLFGMKGTVRDGIKQLAETRDTNSVFGLESNIILGMIYSHLLEETEKAPEFIAQHQLSNSSLAQYFQGIILQKSHQAEKARELWLSSANNVPFSTYLIGESYFQEGNYNESLNYFQQFLSEFDGLTYHKDALLKIALAHKFLGNSSAFENKLEEARASKANTSEIDKNAQKTIDNLENINFEMLKLRYAIDGGFFKSAVTLLSDLEQTTLNKLQLIELTYRKARMAHIQNQPRAVELYKKVIAEADMIEESYFAPNAFLQLGYLQREKSNLDMAKMYFERVLTFKKHPYKASLDSKANVALSLLDLGGD
ncbi:MAG: tetratricopeptide repeat protein [Roseivirga sp.]|uniref:tetratricopeptide repeat protein n=1 Tax=Roseivirga sp. TaxID=1964215 RepID=UPI001B078C1F|nr:tetratricopeptide repeat protein [Roseivirga sp.]MBO6495233.1 tetratricopeptide repeat protein [Roseivirga sp.]